MVITFKQVKKRVQRKYDIQDINEHLKTIQIQCDKTSIRNLRNQFYDCPSEIYEPEPFIFVLKFFNVYDHPMYKTYKKLLRNLDIINIENNVIILQNNYKNFTVLRREVKIDFMIIKTLSNLYLIKYDAVSELCTYLHLTTNVIELPCSFFVKTKLKGTIFEKYLN